jgi:hypothetical protein
MSFWNRMRDRFENDRDGIDRDRWDQGDRWQENENWNRNFEGGGRSNFSGNDPSPAGYGNGDFDRGNYDRGSNGNTNRPASFGNRGPIWNDRGMSNDRGPGWNDRGPGWNDRGPGWNGDGSSRSPSRFSNSENYGGRISGGGYGESSYGRDRDSGGGRDFNNFSNGRNRDFGPRNHNTGSSRFNGETGREPMTGSGTYQGGPDNFDRMPPRHGGTDYDRNRFSTSSGGGWDRDRQPMDRGYQDGGRHDTDMDRDRIDRNRESSRNEDWDRNRNRW